MSERTLNVKIQLKNDTASALSTNNPKLLKGEVCFEIDTRKFKIGDGVNNWNDLSYANVTDLNDYYTKDEIDEILDTDIRVELGDINTALLNKVDKVDGKGLSTNDFTNDYKSKVDSNTTARHTHSNKTLLDTYDQTNANIKDAVTKKHDHSNKDVLDGTTASYTTEEKNKLAGIEANAEKNIIESVFVNGSKQTIDPVFRRLSLTIPVNVSELTNDSEFITSTVNNLANYYTKTNTYTKTEINELVNTIPKFGVEVVASLPTENISTTTIYLVSKSDSEENDYYDEYMYISNKWEMIGNTKIDLTNYYTIAQVDTITNGLRTQINTINNTSLPSKVDKVDGKGLSTNDFTTALLNKLDGIAEGANKTIVDTALSSSSANPVQNRVVNTALDGKAPTNHASNTQNYGVGSEEEWGHVKLYNGDLNDETLSAAQGAAAGLQHNHSNYIDETDTLILDCGNSQS